VSVSAFSRHFPPEEEMGPKLPGYTFLEEIPLDALHIKIIVIDILDGVVTLGSLIGLNSTENEAGDGGRKRKRRKKAARRFCQPNRSPKMRVLNQPLQLYILLILSSSILPPSRLASFF